MTYETDKMVKVRPAAVITSAHHPNALGTARALGASGVELVGLTPRPGAHCTCSRIWDRIVRVRGSDPSSYVDTLLELGPTLEGKPLLIPANDELVRIVSDQRHSLMPHYEIVLPPRETVNLLLDKTAFHAWATARGLPVPKSVIVRSYPELEDALERLTFPVVLKPSSHSAEWDRLSPQNKVYRLDQREDLRKIDVDPFRASDSLLIQRWIQGADQDVVFCLLYRSRSSRRMETFTGRKLVQWPALTGSTAICIGEVNRRIDSITRELFGSLDFQGFGSLEFKYLRGEDQYFITEPTVGRPDLQSYVAARGGTNLVKIALHDVLNRDVPTRSSPKASLWFHEEFLLNGVRNADWRRHFDPLILRSMLHIRTMPAFAFMRLSDPGPILSLLASFAKKGLHNLKQRVLG